MKRIFRFLALALLLLVAACAVSPEPTSTQAAGGTPDGLSLGVTGDLSAELASFRSALTSAGQQGIWVTGSGKVTLEPDLARLTLGVEAREVTVAQAQAQAATALDAIVTELRTRGVAEEEIQTRHFSIQPIISYERVIKNGREYSEQRIEGYRVTNTVVAHIRDLDGMGRIIDAVAEAGGDLIRIQGISFAVEDQAAAHTEARALATEDAIAKAQQFAQLLSIDLGKLLFVTELGGGGPIVQDLAEGRAMAAFEAAPPTPILAGELDVTAQVQVVFAIP